MNELIELLNQYFWLILPLVILQLSVMSIGIWQWQKKKSLLGPNKLIWLLIIIVVNIFGPLYFIYYTRDLHYFNNSKKSYDEWEE